MIHLLQDHTASWVMNTLLFELAKIRDSGKKGSRTRERNMTLHDVGFVMSHMMGHVYKSRYHHIHSKRHPADQDPALLTLSMNTFPHPFDDLFVCQTSLMTMLVTLRTAGTSTGVP